MPKPTDDSRSEILDLLEGLKDQIDCGIAALDAPDDDSEGDDDEDFDE